MTDGKWMVLRAGKWTGPYEEGQLREYVANGHMEGNILVKSDTGKVLPMHEAFFIGTASRKWPFGVFRLLRNFQIPFDMRVHKNKLIALAFFLGCSTMILACGLLANLLNPSRTNYDSSFSPESIPQASAQSVGLKEDADPLRLLREIAERGKRRAETLTTDPAWEEIVSMDTEVKKSDSLARPYYGRIAIRCRARSGRVFYRVLWYTFESGAWKCQYLATASDNGYAQKDWGLSEAIDTTPDSPSNASNIPGHPWYESFLP